MPKKKIISAREELKPRFFGLLGHKTVKVEREETVDDVLSKEEVLAKLSS